MTESDKNTEEKIFESATEVFLEKGLDGTRMQDIADRAGINKSLLHYYYRSKERLFNAVFEKTAKKVFARFAPVFNESLSIEDKIRFFFNEHIAFLQKNPRLPLFLLNEINRNPARIRKFLKDVNVTALWTMLYTHHRDDLIRYRITEESIPQIMTTIVSMSIFPFIARGILETLFGKLELKFGDFLEERKRFAAEFVIAALKK